MKKLAGWFFANIDRITYMYCTLILSCYLVSLGAKVSSLGVFMSILFAFLYARMASGK